ncbi:MAG: tetratricopeptide repeat protein [Burkholderiales bacterium]
MNRLLPLRPLCALAFAILGCGPVLADQILDQARRLLGEQNAAGALALLAPLESDRAGSVEFDFLLGIAALDGGDPQRAVFALERVLSLEPSYDLARAEIARAYFALGEKENATREFKSVRESVPPQARDTIDRYLSALAPARTKLQGYIEGNIGRDSNVNSATTLSEIAIPGSPLMITLSETSRRRHDTFYGLAAGVTFNHDLTDHLALVGSLSGARRFHAHQNTIGVPEGTPGQTVFGFDTAVSDGLLGIRQTIGPDAITVAAQGQSFRLDDRRFRESGGFLVQWQHDLGPRDQVSTFFQQAQLRYPSQPIRDAMRRIVGFAYGHAVPGPRGAVFFGSVYGGNEAARKVGNDPETSSVGFRNLGHKPLGLRLGGHVNAGPIGQVFVALAYEGRTYNAEEPIFGVVRKDKQFDARLGVRYPLDTEWTVTPEVGYTDSRSSIEVNSYTRTVWTLSVRRSF